MKINTIFAEKIYALQLLEFRENEFRRALYLWNDVEYLKKFYDENKGLFTSGADKQVSYASQVWMVLGNVIEPEMGLEVLHNVAAEKDAVEMVTPYIYHYYIEALLKCGAKDEALAVMKNYWGGMAELGADTFWELYNPKNPDESPYGGTIVNSYCHAWSCAPAYFLRRYYSEK